MNIIEQLEAEQAAPSPKAQDPRLRAGRHRPRQRARRRRLAHWAQDSARRSHRPRRLRSQRELHRPGKDLYARCRERVFPCYTPLIEGVEVVRRGKASPKLYYPRGSTGKKARIVERQDKKTVAAAERSAPRSTFFSKGPERSGPFRVGGLPPASTERERKRPAGSAGLVVSARDRRSGEQAEPLLVPAATSVRSGPGSSACALKLDDPALGRAGFVERLRRRRGLGGGRPGTRQIRQLRAGGLAVRRRSPARGRG